MKLSPLNLVLTLIALMVASASAEETIAKDQIAVAIVSLLELENPASAQVLKEIDDGMEDIGSKLEYKLDEVITENTAPLTRKLRGERNLICSPCTGVPAHFTRCYVRINGVLDSYDRCRRALTKHEDLSEEAIANLSEKDRRRHLQVSTICKDAKAAFASTIAEAEVEGVIPLPEGGRFVEQCFYEIKD